MERRNFIKCCSFAVPAAIAFNSIGSKILAETIKEPSHKKYNDDFIKKMADSAISISKKSGASYSDFRLSNFRSQRVVARENVIRGVSDNENFGFSVRVIIDGAWGFAASSTFTESEVSRVAKIACGIEKANKKIQRNRVELIPTPAYTK